MSVRVCVCVCACVCTVCLKSIANASQAIPGSLRSPRLPLPAPAGRGSDAEWGREGSAVNRESNGASPVSDDRQLNRPRSSVCHERCHGKGDVGDYQAAFLMG